MQAFLDSVYFHEHPLDLTVVCRMFELSRSGYYAWLKRKSQEPAKREQAEKESKELMKLVKAVICTLGYVPGARNLSICMFRFFNRDVSRKKCRQLMIRMRLVANMPLKDAYKHQATHDHPYAAPADNLVNRNFFIGPRKVILTDITYLYYSPHRSLFYLCVFKDAYTREILGAAVSTEMSVIKLVRPAYDAMMAKYGRELKQPGVFLHSDQGSQYMSTTFQQLLTDDEFVQSVSARGNSLDNSPMESFFSRMKTVMLNILALAEDYDTAKTLSLNYIDAYTNKIFQYELGGLTPAEFYLYATTGVYPCESYFGVNAKRLLSVERLIEARKKLAEEYARKAREKAEKDKAAGMGAPGKDPMYIVNRDKLRLKKLMKEWEEMDKKAQQQKAHLQDLMNRVDAAQSFIAGADSKLLKALRDKTEWRKYKELSYIYDMKGLF